jgi:hypothetical protein
VQEGFSDMAAEVLRAYEAGEAPRGDEDEFPAVWKAWVKSVGAKLKKKGKHLFHPIR